MTMAETADNLMRKGWQKNTTQWNMLTATQKQPIQVYLGLSTKLFFLKHQKKKKVHSK